MADEFESNLDLEKAPEEKMEMNVSVNGGEMKVSGTIPQVELGEIEKKDTKLEGGAADQLKGLPMRELISAPLIAVCESQQQLAATALNFYKQIAYEDDGKKTRCLEFDLERPVQTPTGISKQPIHVKAPFIGLVPIPSLLIERVDIDFQMEVTDHSESKDKVNTEWKTQETAKWFTLSAEVTGRVTTSRENTRSSNQTAKYQVHVTAAQQQRTEGLSKLMDIMASCIEPMDGTGGGS
ncbi:MAG: DUF2589 domain-containing protein [Synergistaceae bacterium]|nr:DUF2589 domain-containing protein [Synergistaceae bacterium]